MVTEIEMAPKFFIGREDELDLVEELLTAPWGSRQILLVHGPGGVGKTRLLREIYRRREEYTRRSEKPLFFAKIINFDDMSMRLAWSLGQRLATELGREQFREYLDAEEAYAQYGLLGASSDLLREQDQRARREFMRGYNRVAEQKRIFLLTDTMEKVQDTELWHYVQEAIEGMKNTTLVMAGRELDKIKPDLERSLGEEAVCFVSLTPFDKLETVEYFLHTDVGVEIEPEMREKLYLLSGGHPIFIALAVEWLQRDMPIDHITTRPLAALQALDEEGLAQARKEFETILVNKILDLTPIDQAVLRMAHVHLRFDDKILQYLLDLSDEKTVSLSRELRKFPFIRSRPQNIYTLHDEMRRLVNEHTWPKIDPHGTQRRSVSAKMVSYYDEQLEALDVNLGKVRNTWEKAREDEDAEKAAQVFPRLNKLEQQRAPLEVERFHYLLDVDLEQAFDYFLEAFEEATHAYRFALRERIVSEIQEYREQLTSERQYAVDIRRAYYLIDNREYPRAKELLLEMLGREEISPEQHVDISIQLGNVEIRLGNFEEGTTYFADAVKQSVQNNLEELLIAAENALGWAHRLVGDWAKAAAHYKSALRRSLGSEDKHQRALILNNLGYVIGLQPTEEEDVALPLCQQALEIWQELGDARGVGQVFCTKGEILRFHNRLAESLEYFNEAAQIFEPANDLEWLSNVYCGRGIVQFLLDNLEAAQFDLEKAREIDLRRDEPRYLHYLGHVALAQDNIEEARDLFKESYDVSQVTHDLYFEVNSLGDLANIAATQREFNRRPEFKKRLKRYLEKHPEALSRDVGLLLGYLGDLALSEGDLDEAIQNYQKGFLLLTRSGGYGPYTLVGHLERKESRWKEWESEDIISSESIREIGKRLEQFWIKKELDVTHIQALLFFARWKGWGREAE